ncbi:MAG: FAD-dependent oxidoreductase [Pseudomonadota bacterium]
MMNEATDVLIVGAGHAAGQLAVSLRQGGHEGSIMMLGDEPHPPYQRPPLSKKYLAGALEAERLFVKPPSFYGDANIDLHTDTRVTAIDPSKKTATIESGGSVRWQSLVLATGTRARKLPLPGSDLQGVHYLRTASDVDALRPEITAGKRIAIIGGGYIGLEVAAVAREAELEVHVIEHMPRLLSRVVSPLLSDFYASVHEQAGVRLWLEQSVSAIDGDQRVTGVTLSDGTSLDVDIVLIGIGVVPNDELARDAGIDCSNGVDTDLTGRTSATDVFAIGDCCNHHNPIYDRRVRLESVPNALGQARAVAASLLGDDKPYSEVPWFWSDQYDLKLQIVGLTEGYDQTVLRGDPQSRSFACFYLKDGRMLAVDAVNSPREFMRSKALVASGASVPLEALADPSIDLKEFG